MIDTNKLDKRKTYIMLEYGTGLIAGQIRKFSKCYCPNSSKVPTHVAMLRYFVGTWWVYESHAKGYKDLNIHAGVRKYPIDKWFKIEDPEKFSLYQFNLDRKELELHLGEPYSMGDIKSLMTAVIKEANGGQKNSKGNICSEYFAYCYPKICKYYNLPAHCITPAHIQDYVDTLNIEEV